jgi:hypothetical protein
MDIENQQDKLKKIQQFVGGFVVYLQILLLICIINMGISIFYSNDYYFISFIVSITFYEITGYTYKILDIIKKVIDDNQVNKLSIINNFIDKENIFTLKFLMFYISLMCIAKFINNDKYGYVILCIMMSKWVFCIYSVIIIGEKIKEIQQE